MDLSLRKIDSFTWKGGTPCILSEDLTGKMVGRLNFYVSVDGGAGGREVTVSKLETTLDSSGNRQVLQVQMLSLLSQENDIKLEQTRETSTAIKEHEMMLR